MRRVPVDAFRAAHDRDPDDAERMIVRGFFERVVAQFDSEPIKERMGRLGGGVHHLEGLDPSELPAVYNLARVLAHPAWYEGFGFPPLEAMACGTPVVVSDRSSLPELVGDAGLIVGADDPDAWRKALERVIGDSDLAADLKRRGILRAAQFSWQRSAELTWRAVDRAVKTA